MHAHLASRLSAAVVVASLALGAGCTGTDDAPRTPESGDPPVTPTSSSAPTPPTSGTSTPEPSDTGTPLVDRLLPTGLVPGLNAQWRWQDGDTGQPTDDPFGLCARADLISIGAGDVVARSYFPPDDSDDNAAEQIAEFPDARTASLAWAVLKSWHDACPKRRSANPGLRVRPMTSVPVQEGSARWYLLSWSPEDEETGRFEAFGMVLDGTRIAVLRIDNSSPDHDYPPAKEPMVGMVTAAASWLH